MLLEVDELRWSEFILAHGNGSIFVEPIWLSAAATSFGFEIKYYIWKDEVGEVIGFPIFLKGKVIKAPTNFHSFLLVKANRADDQESVAFSRSFEILKCSFRSIRLKTEIDFPYLKELESLGFRIDQKFTYINSLKKLNYSRNISRMIKKAEQQNYVVALSTSFEKAFSMIWASNQSYLIGCKEAQFSGFFSILLKNDFSEIFDLHHNDSHVASLLVIKDQGRRVVYTYLISIPDKSKYAEAQVMLYDYCMTYYKDRDYLFCDLCGANLPAVAKFKSKFKGKLETYQYAVYNSGYFSKIEDYIKKLIKK